MPEPTSASRLRHRRCFLKISCIRMSIVLVCLFGSLLFMYVCRYVKLGSCKGQSRRPLSGKDIKNHPQPQRQALIIPMYFYSASIQAANPTSPAQGEPFSQPVIRGGSINQKPTKKHKIPRIQTQVVAPHKTQTQPRSSSPTIKTKRIPETLYKSLEMGFRFEEQRLDHHTREANGRRDIPS